MLDIACSTHARRSCCSRAVGSDFDCVVVREHLRWRSVYVDEDSELAICKLILSFPVQFLSFPSFQRFLRQKQHKSVQFRSALSLNVQKSYQNPSKCDCISLLRVITTAFMCRVRLQSSSYTHSAACTVCFAFTSRIDIGRRCVTFQRRESDERTRFRTVLSAVELFVGSWGGKR